MARPLRQLEAWRKEYNVPVICAGDIFDKWNPRPELVNFAIRELPVHMYAIPGQHDLPFHRYEDVRKSAYWTLCEANKITNLIPGKPFALEGLLLHGFPWGCEVEPAPHQPLESLNIAVIHSYIWMKDHCFQGASPAKHLSKWTERLKGYQIAVYGDNHKGFLHKGERRTLLNCGGMFRRRSDEKDYQPKVGLVWSDGDVTRLKLDISQDVLLEKEQVLAKTIEKAGGFDNFLESVRDLGNSTADFMEAVWQAMDKRDTSPLVRDFIAQAMEKKK